MLSLPLLFALTCVTSDDWAEAKRPGGPLDPQGRPILSGPEVIYLSEDGLFKVHYTLSGADALGNTDDVDPANGVPDGVDWAMEGMAKVYQEFVLTDGWPPPPTDELLGGDNRMDVYMRIIDANGYAHNQSLPSGAKASWVELHPSNTLSSDKASFQSVAGHELHHVLQFAVTNRLPTWMYEGTATWAQYLLFSDDLLLAAREVLWRIRLHNAHLALDSTAEYQFHYAGMIWFKFLVDYGARAGDADRKSILKLWQTMGAEGNWEEGHDVELPRTFGLANLDDAATEFAVWNWFACNGDDGFHYDPTTLACGGASVSVDVANTFPHTTQTQDLGRHGSAYVLGVPDCTSGELAFDVRPAVKARFAVVKIPTLGESVVTFEDVAAGEQKRLVVADWNHWHRVLLTVTNNGNGAGAVNVATSVSGTYAPPATAPAPTQLTIDAPLGGLQLRVGDTSTLAAKAMYGTCADGEDVSTRVTWSTSDENVVKVQNGVLTAVGVGSADVSARSGGVASNRVTVVVAPAPASGGGCAVGGEASGGGALLLLLVLALRRRRVAPLLLLFAAARAEAQHEHHHEAEAAEHHEPVPFAVPREGLIPGTPQQMNMLHVMVNGFAHLQNVEGGETEALLTGTWIMGSWRNQQVEALVMFNLEPFSVDKDGYALLGQQGEELWDAQHSHNLFHQAMVAYHPLDPDDDLDLSIFGGIGSATIGPPIFMHRASAPGPTVPRKHHKGENPHETAPVLGAALRLGDVTIEGSVFSGKELTPDDSRLYPHFAAPKSYAGRVRLTGEGFELQVSGERLRDQGPGVHDAFQASASAYLWKDFDGWRVDALLDYGVDVPDEHDESNAFLAEIAVRRPQRRDTLWLRGEFNQREEPDEMVSSPWFFGSVGYERVVVRGKGLDLGIFAEATWAHIPEELARTYRRDDAVTLNVGLHLLGMWMLH